MVLEPVIYKKSGGTNYSDYPIGSVILSASANVGPEWLRCSGAYINESQYPELTAFLGKNSPGTQDAFPGGEGAEYTGTFSTSYLYQGYVWVYWFEGKSLLGYPVTGDPVHEIAVTGNFDFVQSPDAPVVLSICGGRVFLAQTAGNLSYIYLYSGPFSMAAASISITKTDMTSVLPEAENLRTYKLYLPEVVLLENYTVGSASGDYFAMMGYSKWVQTVSSPSAAGPFEYYAFLLPKESPSTVQAVKVLTTTSRVIKTQLESPYVASLLRFGRKTSDEAIVINGANNQYNVDTTLASVVNGVYQSGNTETVLANQVYADPVLVSPIASSEFYIYRAYIHNGAMYLRAGRVTPFTAFENTDYTENPQKINGISLSPYAQLFPDSLAYLDSHNMFVIFVGCGFLFSHTPLDMDSWGYLDTADYFGIISQWGGVEFDPETNTLCLSGRSTQGSYLCGLLKLHQTFHYSNDGAWLPYIASDGVPAWIKAKETAAAAEEA